MLLVTLIKGRSCIINGIIKKDNMVSFDLGNLRTKMGLLLNFNPIFKKFTLKMGFNIFLNDI
ncbi:hypothetical protein, partial [Flavobacterium davisii]|uniref:hypothetical protein n=1 Tax=Flavobacterium davisii TaxID=2906077 RepID=UPI001F4376AF